MDQLPALVDGRPHKGILNCSWHDQVNLSIQQGLQCPFQPKVGIEKVGGGVGFELNQEIDVTARGIEVISASRGAENLQPPNVKASANFSDLRLFTGD
jgi:hypothetical protein